MGHEHAHDELEHGHSISGELIHHLPYAIFSVSFGLLFLSLFSALFAGQTDPILLKKSSKILFHSFHFMHVVFAATGTVITFVRFSKNYLLALFVGALSPAFFCMLSDAVLPYIGGSMFGVHMHFHLCFISEPLRVLPFLIIGILNGFVLSRHHDEKQSSYSRNSHAVHILVSALASTFYLISHGFTNWHSSIGGVFVFLIFAVVVPCTLADVVVPIAVAKSFRKK